MWARTCSLHPPPRPWVNPSVRPPVRTRLSRLRHDDVQPSAQLAHGGSIPRTAHGRQGSTTTVVPTGCGHDGPASITCPAISWPRTKGIEPIEARVGEGPVLCANRWRSLPQIPPVVTAIRAQAGPGRSGSGNSTSDAGKAASAMSNWTARTPAAYVLARLPIPRWACPTAPGVLCEVVRVSDAALEEVRERGFALVEGFLAPEELAAAQQALWLHFPKPEDYFADPGSPTNTHKASSRGSRSSRTGRGTSTAWPSTRIWSTPPSAIWARPNSICTRSSCGPNMPAPATTTSPCTGTSAVTAWWSPVKTAVISS